MGYCICLPGVKLGKREIKLHSAQPDLWERLTSCRTQPAHTDIKRPSLERVESDRIFEDAGRETIVAHAVGDVHVGNTAAVYKADM
jgi:hypothetical protein